MAKRASMRARRRPSRVKATPKRKEALQKQMAKAFELVWGRGFKRMRANISAEAMANAYAKGEYNQLIKLVPFDRLSQYLADALAVVGKANVTGAGWGKDAAPDLNALRYDLSSPAVSRYIAERQGAYIQNTNEEFTKSVQQMVQTRFATAASDRAGAQALLDPVNRGKVAGFVLKNSVGLDARSSGALAKRTASGNYTQEQLAKYESDLHVARAARVARTEVAYAANNGQLNIWKEAQTQGLISANAKKIWVVDGAPCPICQPMDGLSVGINELFLAPNGDSVLSPPIHTNCLCQLAFGGGDDDDESAV